MITIRNATLADLDMLLGFEQGIVEAERPFDATMVATHFHYYDLAEMIGDDDCAVVVAEADGALIGSGSGRIQEGKPFNNFERYAFLGFMYVSPDFRGRGINAKIIDALCSWAKSKGLDEVRLQVYSENTGAVKAYEKAGFKPLLTEMRLAT